MQSSSKVLIQLYENYNAMNATTKDGDSPKFPAHAELTATLKEMLLGGFERVYIAVDALDEMQKVELETLVRDVANLTELEHVLVSLFLTSRPIDYIISRFEVDSLQLPILATSEDLKTFINGQFKEKEDLANLVWRNDTLKKRILEEVPKKAKGMYVYVTSCK